MQRRAGFYTEGGPFLKRTRRFDRNMAKKLRVGILLAGAAASMRFLCCRRPRFWGDRSRKVRRDAIGSPKKAAGWRPRTRRDREVVRGGGCAAAARGRSEADAGPAVARRVPTLMAPEPPVHGSGPKTNARTAVPRRRLPRAHGTFGEDGTISGLFDWRVLPIWSGVLGSAAAWTRTDERLFVQAKLPIVKHVTLLRADWRSRAEAIRVVEKTSKFTRSS